MTLTPPLPERPTRKVILARLEAMLEAQHDFARVHPDATEPFARAALEQLAGLPGYELVLAGQFGDFVLVACVAGERVSGVELVRRSGLLFGRAAVLAERMGGTVTALQLVLYERQVPKEERDQVLSRARHVPLFGGHARVATWLFALDEPALHVRRFPGWPVELSAEELRKLLISPAA